MTVSVKFQCCRILNSAGLRMGSVVSIPSYYLLWIGSPSASRKTFDVTYLAGSVGGVRAAKQRKAVESMGQIEVVRVSRWTCSLKAS